MARTAAISLGTWLRTDTVGSIRSDRGMVQAHGLKQRGSASARGK
jgi:hypothetical protein